MKRRIGSSFTKIVLFSTAALFTHLAQADEYTGPGHIENMRTLDSGNSFALIGDWDSARADGCTDTSRWVVGSHASTGVEQVRAMYSMVLAAYLSGNTVELRVDGCTAGGKPIVYEIWLPEL